MAAATTVPVLGIIDQLPLLVVVVPMIAAPLCVLFGNRTIAWILTFAASLASLLFSLHLLLQVMDGDVVSYWLGGWGPKDGGIAKGIEYRIDAANAFVLVLISLISTIVLPYARRSIEFEITKVSHTLFYCCYLLCFTGLLGVVATGDAFNVFVFLEISSLSTYVLVAMGAERDKRALTAAYDYLILGTIGATFFVIGIGFLYSATGTLNMEELSVRLPELGTNRTVQVGFAFVVVGMGLKAAFYPLHLWLPGAYTFAPSVVTAFLAGTATKAAIYVLLRFLFTVFNPEMVFNTDALSYLLIPLAVLAMFAGSLIAVFQTELKRLLAYSSVAQVGYMALGIGFLSTTGVTATMVHLFNHGITKAALFLVVGAYVLRAGTSFTDRLAGLGRQMPWTSAAFVIGGLSLIGVPGTAGFISKWVLLQAALEKDWWWMGLLIVASSLLAVIYVWRIVEILYLQQPRAGKEIAEAPLSMLVPIWILAIACIWFGFATEMTIGASETAANSLIGGRS
ncbi:MAG: monovalent cation/H+ antiporter subunit D family protein [Rhizobiaceae bacterium]|jgi:multicomponent Na+:H+ antiporter subunit D|nr:monovalent cation/H+ antiporter subunit D family protein [Rhizobiaceae bacterium]